MPKDDKHSDRTGSLLSEKFDILSHPVRRRLLVAVNDKNPQDEDDLASNSIVGDGENLEMLEQEMYHCHLPKLEEAGFINWDRDTGTITRGPRFEEIEPLIKLMNDHQDELPDDWP
jgi:hypothetical protein